MVYTLGESLLDIIIEDLNKVAAKPGGSMLNATVSLCRAGIPAALITELGDDETGNLIVDFLQKSHASVNLITRYKAGRTVLAIATLDADKKPHYTFLKSYPGQRMLAPQPGFTRSDILLFGSLYSLDPDIRPVLKTYVKAAKDSGALIVYDPNIRHPETLDNPVLKEALMENFRMADIIKGSDEDYGAVFGKQDAEKQLESLHQINPEALIIMTAGKDGAMALYDGHLSRISAPAIKVVSTIGAGDGFNAGMIAFIAKAGKQARERIKSDILFRESLLRTGIEFASSVCESEENYISETFEWG
ncbi:MAG: carbohydrate kinase [Bacteroidales bacterium]|nr:carbohydrate kinase [Bacteroidales bacterium]